MKCSAFLALVVSALVLAGSAGAGVNVWFVADGKPVSVPRNGTTPKKAVEQLLAGPTAAERRRGIRSAVPRATPLRSITVTHRVVTVDLGARFAAGRDGRLLQDRVGQLVRTLRGIPGVRGVQVLDRRRRAGRPLPRLRPQKAGGGPGRAGRAARALDARHPAATDRSRLHGSLGADRNARHADLDGGARVSEVGEPSARRRSRRLDPRSARAGNAPRAPAADARPPDRGAASPPARAPDRGQPRRARRSHLVGGGWKDADRVVPRLSQGALLVVGAVQGLAAVGELLHGRHRLPRVPGRSRRTRHPTAACA